MIIATAPFQIARDGTDEPDGACEPVVADQHVGKHRPRRLPCCRFVDVDPERGHRLAGDFETDEAATAHRHGAVSQRKECRHHLHAITVLRASRGEVPTTVNRGSSLILT
jgi:hypothetical protein